MLNLLLSITLLLLNYLASVDAALSLEVQIRSTPFNSTKGSFAPSASSNVTYQLCLKPLWSSDTHRELCSYGVFHTSGLDSSLKFAPIRLDGLKGGFKLVISIFNGTVLFGVADVLDRIPLIFDSELTLQDDFSIPVTFEGEKGMASLYFSYKLSSDCPTHYYGHDCSLFCKVSEPNYVCNYLGSLVCKGDQLWPECSECKPGKNCDPLEFQRTAPFTLRDYPQASDNSSDNSVTVKAAAGTIGALYGIYLLIGTGYYAYVILESFEYDRACNSTILIWLLLYPVYLAVLTLLFPFFLCLFVVVAYVCGNK